MEDKMISMFLFSLILTFLLVRIGAHYLHDKKNYNTKKEKSRTITFWLRRKTGYNIHHIHIGILMLLTILPLIIFKEISIVLIGALGTSLSLIADQTLPLFNKNIGYFDNKNLISAIFLHILIIIIALISKIS
jgi:hypothetical protein